MYNKRGEQERKEEQKLADATGWELWSRWCASLYNEFFSCLFYFTVVLACRVAGSTLEIQALCEALTIVGVLSVWVRENAGHLDPVITIMLTIEGRLGLPWYFMFAHLLGQACAAVLATAFALSMTPGFDRALGLGTPVLAFGYTPGQGLEYQLWGCLLIYTVFIWLVTSAGTVNFFETTGPNFRFGSLFAIACGFAHGGAALAFGAVAGTYFNFYLYIFPAAISGTLDSSNWWLWFVAPPAAGFFALCVCERGAGWTPTLGFPKRKTKPCWRGRILTKRDDERRRRRRSAPADLSFFFSLLLLPVRDRPGGDGGRRAAAAAR